MNRCRDCQVYPFVFLHEHATAVKYGWVFHTQAKSSIRLVVAVSVHTAWSVMPALLYAAWSRPWWHAKCTGWTLKPWSRILPPSVWVNSLAVLTWEQARCRNKLCENFLHIARGYHVKLKCYWHTDWHMTYWKIAIWLVSVGLAHACPNKLTCMIVIIILRISATFTLDFSEHYFFIVYVCSYRIWAGGVHLKWASSFIQSFSDNSAWVSSSGPGSGSLCHTRHCLWEYMDMQHTQASTWLEWFLQVYRDTKINLSWKSAVK